MITDVYLCRLRVFQPSAMVAVPAGWPDAPEEVRA
jgi:hypothetical protein